MKARRAPADPVPVSDLPARLGGDILPGFAVPVARLFEGLPPPAPPKPARKRK